MDPLRHIASLPEIATRNTLCERLSSPERCGSDRIHPAKLPSRTKKDNTLNEHNPVEESAPDKTALPGEGSNDFDSALDYLATVEEPAEGISPGLYNELFEKNYTRDPGHSDCGVLVTESRRIFLWDDDHARKEWCQVVRCASEENPCVIIVEELTTNAIQFLGVALDVSPAFFATHFGGGNVLAEMRSNLKELHDRYRALLESRREKTEQPPNFTYQIGADAAKEKYTEGDISGLASHKIAMNNWRTFSTGYSPFSIPGAMSVRISCTMVANYAWLLLVTLHDPTVNKEYGPFHRRNMVEFSGCLLPIHLGLWENRKPQISVSGNLQKVLSDGPLRKNLFGHHQMDLYGALAILFPFMVVNAWRENVGFMEGRLEQVRHNAIVSPSMDTFIPLTVVRRNLAQLEQALSNARKAPGWTARWTYCKSGAEADDGQSEYDSLLQRVKNMSILLNNEIQLVIGSVTVQISGFGNHEEASAKSDLVDHPRYYLPAAHSRHRYLRDDIKEINGGTPLFWACIVGLVIIAGLTMAGYFGYRLWRKGHDAREAEERRREDKIYKLA